MTFDATRARAIIEARNAPLTQETTTAAVEQPVETETPTTKEKPMADEQNTDLASIQAKATADAVAAFAARNAAVTSSEHYKGREAIANAMLNDPEMASKSADSIIAMMKLSPAHGEQAKDLEARENADQRAMLAGITAVAPASLGDDVTADSPKMTEDDRLLNATVDALAQFK
jgi:hypothetical protein